MVEVGFCFHWNNHSFMFSPHQNRYSPHVYHHERPLFHGLFDRLSHCEKKNLKHSSVLPPDCLVSGLGLLLKHIGTFLPAENLWIKNLQTRLIIIPSRLGLRHNPLLAHSRNLDDSNGLLQLTFELQFDSNNTKFTQPRN